MKPLVSLHSQIRKCRKCRLWKSRMKAVPGEGPNNARIMFIGQAPGKTEDASGRPFVGRAGKFFDELLGIAGLDREKVFITSVVKCFPPKNRIPKSDEIKSCNPFLQAQLQLVKPKVVVLLGNVAIRTVLGTQPKLETGPIEAGKNASMVHGTKRRSIGNRKLTIPGTQDRKPIRKAGITYISTFHPAAGMRFPKIRRQMEKDFRNLRKLLQR